LKGPEFTQPPPVPGGHIYALGVQVGVAAAGDVFTVGTHAVFVAVEEGRVLGGCGVQGPVPVGEGTFVTTESLQV